MQAIAPYTGSTACVDVGIRYVNFQTDDITSVHSEYSKTNTKVGLAPRSSSRRGTADLQRPESGRDQILFIPGRPPKTTNTPGSGSGRIEPTPMSKYLDEASVSRAYSKSTQIDSLHTSSLLIALRSCHSIRHDSIHFRFLLIFKIID